MMAWINAIHFQALKRGQHDEVGAKDQAETAANQGQAAAAPETDQEAMENIMNILPVPQRLLGGQTAAA